MKFLKFLILGILFGIILSKAEVISWYRIIEMFRFESFHMYGIIGSAVVIGAVSTQIMKKTGLNSIDGSPIYMAPKEKGVTRYLMGGVFFGLGWALIGACPGPMFILLGRGVFTILIVIAGALAGTFVYGLLRNRLPH